MSMTSDCGQGEIIQEYDLVGDKKMTTNSRTGKAITDMENSRRRFLKSAGKLAAYAPPAMVLLMQPSRDAVARSAIGEPRMKCNNGIGNGSDCLPPGLEKNGKKPMQILAAIVRKLLLMVRSVIVTGKAYDPEYGNAVHCETA